MPKYFCKCPSCPIPEKPVRASDFYVCDSCFYWFHPGCVFWAGNIVDSKRKILSEDEVEWTLCCVECCQWMRNWLNTEIRQAKCFCHWSNRRAPNTRCHRAWSTYLAGSCLPWVRSFEEGLQLTAIRVSFTSPHSHQLRCSTAFSFTNATNSLDMESHIARHLPNTSSVKSSVGSSYPTRVITLGRCKPSK